MIRLEFSVGSSPVLLPFCALVLLTKVLGHMHSLWLAFLDAVETCCCITESSEYERNLASASDVKSSDGMCHGLFIAVVFFVGPTRMSRMPA